MKKLHEIVSIRYHTPLIGGESVNQISVVGMTDDEVYNILDHLPQSAYGINPVLDNGSELLNEGFQKGYSRFDGVCPESASWRVEGVLVGQLMVRGGESIRQPIFSDKEEWTQMYIQASWFDYEPATPYIKTMYERAKREYAERLAEAQAKVVAFNTSHTVVVL